MQSPGTPNVKQPVISVRVTPSSNVVKLGSELLIKVLVINASDHDIRVAMPYGKEPQAELLNLVDVRDEDGKNTIARLGAKNQQ
jgi:hypothetical protein